MAKMDKDEFVRRFTARLVEKVGSETFADGSSVVDYGNDVAPSYFGDPYYMDGDSDDAPEDWADEDMSYWDYEE